MNKKPTVFGWMKAHPGKVVLFLLSCFLAGKFGSWAHLLLIVPAIIIVQYWRQAVTVLLVALFFMGPEAHATEDHPPQPTGQLACGVAVLVVGGIIVYTLGKWCSKKFPKTPPKETNSPPEQSFVLMAAPGGTDMGASFSDGCESCWIPDGMAASWEPMLPAKSFEIMGTVELVEGEAQLRILNTALTPVPEGREDASMTTEEYRAVLATHGLQLATAYGDQFFGYDGRPATQAEVPIYFVRNEDYSRSVQVGNVGPFYTVVFEKSPDMLTWYPLGRMNLAVGQVARYIDLSATDQMFYRLRRN